MLRILQFIFAVLGIAFATYGLITGNFQFQNYMMLSLGLMFLVMSIQEFKEDRKAYGWLLLVTSLFTLFVTVQGFLLS
ncbi:YczI family protein [Virgibacillus halodenitrificans]|uniref:YczI family protein n=1 Tax=Virgibacillus halodenitrificans TaxID=1482 RepID=UPI001FB1C7ED|nr:YczI family protein [Virgibacillus halodenitrificans]MCJ0932071.1 YczI family protein [Virgibacillus halodenitrificans]